MKASPSVRKYNRKTSNNSLSKIKVPKDNEQSYLSQAYTAKNNQTNNQSIFIEGDENFAQLKILTQ